MSIMDLVEAKEKETGVPYQGVHEVKPVTVPVYHYEKQKTEFEPGEVYKNFNGQDYRFIERYKEDRYLMLRLDTGMYLVAYDPVAYERNPIGKLYEKQYGLEWNHARYISSRFADVDMEMLREQYGEYRKPDQPKVLFYRPKSEAMTERRIR